MTQILMFVDEIYEDLELWYPKIRLEEAGYTVVVAGPQKETIYHGKHGYPCRVDTSIAQCHAQDFQGVVIPGGFAPDKLRRDPRVRMLTREIYEADDLVAFICHGGWIPISAKILKGKRATGTIAIKDDLENAGAIWEDRDVVVDHNLISSRTPADLAPFMRAILAFLDRH